MNAAAVLAALTLSALALVLWTRRAGAAALDAMPAGDAPAAWFPDWLLSTSAGVDDSAPVPSSPAGSPAPVWRLPEQGAPYRDLIYSAAEAAGIPSLLLARVLWQESRFNPSARSGAGAQGIAQFMPGTAADLQVDPWNPQSAIPGAARYLAQLYGLTGSWSDALGAYNWGIGNVQRRGLAAAPAETRAYVSEILSDLGGIA